MNILESTHQIREQSSPDRKELIQQLHASGQDPVELLARYKIPSIQPDLLAQEKARALLQQIQFSNIAKRPFFTDPDPTLFLSKEDLNRATREDSLVTSSSNSLMSRIKKFFSI